MPRLAVHTLDLLDVVEQFPVLVRPFIGQYFECGEGCAQQIRLGTVSDGFPDYATLAKTPPNEDTWPTIVAMFRRKLPAVRFYDSYDGGLTWQPTSL